MAGYIGNKAVGLNVTTGDILGDVGVGGVVTANAGVVVDEMTLDADTLTATDTFTVDAEGIITLDSNFGDGAIIRLADGGTQFGDLFEVAGDFLIASAQVDKDIIFKGNDGGSIITALTLDMSAGGAATFNSTVNAGAGLRFATDGSNNGVITTLGQDKALFFAGDDDGGGVNALVLDMSEAGDATFNRNIGLGASDVSIDTRLHIDACPDDKVITFEQSGRKFAIGTFFSSGSTLSRYDFYLSDGNTNGGNNNRMSILSSGDVQVKTGNLVIGTDGKGIDFSATGDGAGTDTSELLDDYEEGTFTPSFTSSNTGFTSGSLGYSNQNGFYTKVGRKVSIHIQLIVDTTPSGANGDLKIAGLPYAGASGVQHGPGLISFYNGFTSQTNQASAMVYLEAASTVLNVAFQEFSGVAAFVLTPAAALHNANPRLTCQMDYFV